MATYVRQISCLGRASRRIGNPTDAASEQAAIEAEAIKTGEALPAPHRDVWAAYQDPLGARQTVLRSRPSSMTQTYAGVLPGAAPRSDRPISAPEGAYSAAWTPNGPTLMTAVARFGAQQDAAADAEANQAAVEVGAGGADYRGIIALGAGLAGAYLLLSWFGGH